MDGFKEEDLKAALREDLRRKWKRELQEKEAGNRPAKRRRIRPALGWAAAIALVITLGLWLTLPGPPTDATDLFAEYFDPLPNTMAPELRGDQQDNILRRALQSYDVGAYRLAIAHFDSLASPYPDGLQLYRGISHLATGQNDRAETDLLQAVAGSYRSSAEWYLALTYLNSGKPADALSVLERIAAAPEHPFRDQAATLLRDLR